MSEKTAYDPRDAMVQTKFYTHVPDPLFDLFVKKRIPRGPMLVFLMYWRAGMINGDFCSEIPIETVADRCGISTSAVTRAYQLLVRQGLLRRIDPGRDSRRPFQQAVKLTEVRLPAELLTRLDGYPNRGGRRKERSEENREENPKVSTHEPALTPCITEALKDPFAGLKGRERVAAQGRLLSQMSRVERARYDEAFAKRLPSIVFDPDSRLSEAEQTMVQQLLRAMTKPSQNTAVSYKPSTPMGSPCTTPTRRLALPELARVRHALEKLCSADRQEELMRQIVWSVEQGALSRFTPRFACHIALKKVREGAWTRPNKMPPNWALSLSRAERPSAFNPLKADPECAPKEHGRVLRIPSQPQPCSCAASSLLTAQSLPELCMRA